MQQRLETFLRFVSLRIISLKKFKSKNGARIAAAEFPSSADLFSSILVLSFSRIQFVCNRCMLQNFQTKFVSLRANNFLEQNDCK